MITKKCTRCGKELPIDEFYPNYDARERVTYSTHCKECVKEKARAWSKKYRIPKRDMNRSPDPDSITRVCGICGKELPISRFSKSKKGRYGIAPNCIDCVRERSARYREKYRNYMKSIGARVNKIGDNGVIDDIRNIYISKIEDKDIYPEGFSYAK